MIKGRFDLSVSLIPTSQLDAGGTALERTSLRFLRGRHRARNILPESIFGPASAVVGRDDGDERRGVTPSQTGFSLLPRQHEPRTTNRHQPREIADTGGGEKKNKPRSLTDSRDGVFAPGPASEGAAVVIWQRAGQRLLVFPAENYIKKKKYIYIATISASNSSERRQTCGGHKSSDFHPQAT